MSLRSRTGEAKKRLAVVSGYGNRALTPRGQRTAHLMEELERRWDVDLIAMPAKEPSVPRDGSVSPIIAARRLAGKALFRIVLDRWEPWALRRLSRWHPDADAALLIATPWSPVVYASRRLVAAGVPYVVDVGDPWVLTLDSKITAPLWRARRAERFLWRGAAGAVVTTQGQGERLGGMFPELPIMVRPNGYRPVSRSAETTSPAAQDPSCLRLAHFGTLTAARVELAPVLAELMRRGCWSSIVFTQFGNDTGIGLERVPEGVRVERRPARPWSEVIEIARDFDAAVVVGNPLIDLLPSKAVEYLTLPIPRIALTNSSPADALRSYAEAHDGWLVISAGEADLASRVAAHVAHPWSADQLAPPAREAWPVVAAQVADFVAECIEAADVGSKEPGGAQPAPAA
jgi:hypothetical protein